MKPLAQLTTTSLKRNIQNFGVMNWERAEHGFRCRFQEVQLLTENGRGERSRDHDNARCSR